MTDTIILPHGYHANVETDDADVTESVQPSECEGLIIWQDGVRIIGYEKHCSDFIDSHDILPAILKKYPDFPIVLPTQPTNPT